VSVQQGLKRLQQVWVKISERPDVAEITGYDKWGMNAMLEALEKAIKRYEAEAARIRKIDARRRGY